MTDNKGNSIIVENKGASKKLFLKLRGKKRRRNLGVIKNGVIYMTRDSSKHLMYKFNGIGFNHFVLSETRDAKKLHLTITDMKKSYLLDIEDVLRHGRFYQFNKKGFELQIFLTLDQLDILNEKS